MGATILRGDLGSPIANGLIAALNRELSGLYPEPGATHFRLDPEEVAHGRGAFLIAMQDGVAVGCGAIRRIDGQSAELKRMYVAPEARGRGIGRQLVQALEEEAYRLGASTLVLETGIRQIPAIRLYHEAGFRDVPPYGEYRTSPTSLCMAKTLEPREDLR